MNEREFRDIYVAMIQPQLVKNNASQNAETSVKQTKVKYVNVAYTYTQRKSFDSMEYDPRMGWYTAAVLLTILMLVTLFLVVDKLRRSKYKRWRRKWARERRRRMEVIYSSFLVISRGTT